MPSVVVSGQEHARSGLIVEVLLNLVQHGTPVSLYGFLSFWFTQANLVVHHASQVSPTSDVSPKPPREAPLGTHASL